MKGFKLKERLECTLRGPITWADFRELRPIIEKDWGAIHHTSELVVFLRAEKDLRLSLILIFPKTGMLVGF